MSTPVNQIVNELMNGPYTLYTPQYRLLPHFRKFGSLNLTAMSDFVRKLRSSIVCSLEYKFDQKQPRAAAATSVGLKLEYNVIRNCYIFSSEPAQTTHEPPTVGTGVKWLYHGVKGALPQRALLVVKSRIHWRKERVRLERVSGR